MTEVNGMAVTFAMNLAYVVVDKPQGYSAEDAKKTLESYEKTEDTKQDTQDLPNIIVIMDEAFSDLAVLGDLQTNEDYMPFMHKMQQGQKNTITGYAQVSVCGGNTANSEFEFLTGDTMAFCRRKMCIPAVYKTGYPIPCKLSEKPWVCDLRAASVLCKRMGQRTRISAFGL
ncbi:MAG: hypothetical protein ACLR78_02305 [Roseburia sp.]